MLGTLLKWFDDAPAKVKRDAGGLNKPYEGDRGIDDLAGNDAELRLWLPVLLKSAMDECTTEMDVTAAKYLREFLAVYLYGAHELLRMKTEKTGLYFVRPPAPPSGLALFSRAHTIDCIPGLGKNIAPIKLHLHRKMKADLESLAAASGVPLGQFVREILVSHFLGHTVWPGHKQSWTEAQKAVADDWETGRIEGHCITEPSTDEEAAIEGRVEHIYW
ncbi:MAG: hypothetical protein Q7V00_12280 [Sulfurimicrobium sp.]|nr:hypothetical protein [Sulfurimicrobium sp.]MDP2200202.1 hypothetical protein [Sulfurimicrobium sp.]MDP3687255.1 hypothetical protein [Sulfurimicrobium sp.]